MTGHSPRLNPLRTTLRPWRALFNLLLRAFTCTAVILGCGLYYLNEALLPAPVKPAEITAAPAKSPSRRTYLKSPPKAPPAPGPKLADPLSLIKASKPVADSYGNESDAGKNAARPRLKAVTFAGSGGRFIPIGQEEREQAPGSRTESARRDLETVLLPASALSKKITVKGAKPVSVLAGKKYSGVDPEAEFLRERMRRQAAAAEASRLQLRKEKLLLTGWLALLALAAMLIPSRVIKAWRLIQKPEGSHWTLR